MFFFSHEVYQLATLQQTKKFLGVYIPGLTKNIRYFGTNKNAFLERVTHNEFLVSV
jgi:hypothetical protein